MKRGKTGREKISPQDNIIKYYEVAPTFKRTYGNFSGWQSHLVARAGFKVTSFKVEGPLQHKSNT